LNYYLESLGCPKNLVDGHGLARLLKGMGHRPVADPAQAQVLIVNTCGFIADARAESIGELRELASRKRPDQVLIAAGCLSQRWGQELTYHVPGIDGLLGTRRWTEIEVLLKELSRLRGKPPRDPLALLDDPQYSSGSGRQRFARQGASAYLKIADGCSAPCAFCAIPLIKGPAASRPAAAIVDDALELVEGGAKEIILIAQDTTAYGRDRGEVDGLPGLMEAILEAAPGGPDGLRWLRLMYAYPGRISPRLVEVMAGDPRVCHYLDLPLQHAHPAVLRRMKRPADLDRTRRLVGELREAMPDLALRTAFIVGYPGETEAEFEDLLDFVEEIRPDRMGVFLYSPEDGTTAAELADDVPDEVKEERHDRLMALQQAVSLEINQAQVGRTLEVLVEGAGDGLSVGRSYRDAPEIDGLVFFPGEAPEGEMALVRITEALEYDLMGEADLEN
jgi:ribosomal protein S12 methylthiotransferase